MSRLSTWWRARAAAMTASAAASTRTAGATPAAVAARPVPPLFRPDVPVAVCWSAKAGCTTVLKWFLHHAGLLEAATARSPWPHDYRCKVLMNPFDAYVAACRASLRSRDVEVIKVVRDPARRAVSSYLHLLREGAHPGWNHGVDAWKQGVGLGRQPGLSFEQFLHFVIDVQEAGRPLDIHFRPQSEPAWDARVERVIRLEGLADGLAEVERLHGLPRSDVSAFSESPHHNRPHGRHGWPRDAARFAATSAHVRDLGTPPAEALLDDRTVDLVRRAYGVDYEAYGHLYALPSVATVRRAA